jgi:hypothetical protein
MANIKLGISVNGFIKDHSQINAFEEATRSLDAHLKVRKMKEGSCT